MIEFMSKKNIKFHCEKCGKVIDTDVSEFYIYKDISDAPKGIYDIMNVIINEEHHLSRHFCSNKCYNLFFWENIVLRSSLYNVIESEAMGCLLTTNSDSMTSATLGEVSLEDLEKYVEQKIRYIEDNL